MGFINNKTIDLYVFAGVVLNKLSVKAMDSRDELGRGRFFPFTPEGHLFAGPYDPKFWYWTYVYYNTTEVSFDHVRILQIVIYIYCIFYFFV